MYQHKRKNLSSIDQLKSNTLSFEQLKYLVGPKISKQCRWIIYDDLTKFRNIEELMSLGAVVILLEIESKNAPKVGHFIVLLNHKTHYEHFDSYGLTMDEERNITQEHHLTNIFKNSPKRIVDNTTRLQLNREDINTCGRWVVGRLLLKHLELDEFIQLFTHLRPQTPDEMITVMTMLLEYDK